MGFTLMSAAHQIEYLSRRQGGFSRCFLLSFLRSWRLFVGPLPLLTCTHLARRGGVLTSMIDLWAMEFDEEKFFFIPG